MTETWLDKQIATDFRGVNVIQSPPSRNQGVMVVIRDTCAHVQPIFPHYWSASLFAAKVKLKRHNTPLIVLAYYSQPGNRAILNEQRDHLLDLIRKVYKHTPIIIGGDFNAT